VVEDAEMKDPYELWLNQACESEVTYGKYLSTIGRFEVWIRENYGLEARAIPSRWRSAKYKSLAATERFLDELKDLLKDYFAYLKGCYTPLTVNCEISVVISYLHAFDIPVKPLRLKHAYVTYHNRDIEKEEIRRILDHSSVRNRAIDLMLYESGTRPDTLVNLKWKHIREEFLGHKIPMEIELSSDILKCRVSKRWTFIGEDGFEALKRYLTTRLPLKDEDYLFVREKPKGGKMGPSAVSQAFNRIVLKLGLAEPEGTQGKPKDLRLYCLRKAFRKFMVVEEAYKEFWMGHTSTATHYVSSDPEYHRKLYAEGYKSLRLYKPEADAETIAKLREENVALLRKIEGMERRLNKIGLNLGVRDFLNLPENERAELYKQLKEAYERAQSRRRKP